MEEPLPAAIAVAVAAPQLQSPGSSDGAPPLSTPRRASFEYRQDSDLVKVREEAWYYQYVHSVTDAINMWAEKRK